MFYADADEDDFVARGIFISFFCDLLERGFKSRGERRRDRGGILFFSNHKKANPTKRRCLVRFFKIVIIMFDEDDDEHEILCVQ